jgi:hypothetical protein
MEVRMRVTLRHAEDSSRLEWRLGSSPRLAKYNFTPRECVWGKEKKVMRALLCHCRLRLEAQDDRALLALVRKHLIEKHPAIPTTDDQVEEIVEPCAYDLHYAQAYAAGFDAAEEEFGIDPY